MSRTHEIIFAGFGGQGILFSGKVTAYAGLVDDKFVSWLPSYGPEMRGGTANCSVILSDKPVGSPIVLNPTELVVMNKPSFEKFEKAVVSGGSIYLDSSLIDVKSSRDDVKQFLIPATELANEMDIPKLANMIILGKMIKESGAISFETAVKGIEKSVPPTKKELLEVNIKALELGYNY